MKTTNILALLALLVFIGCNRSSQESRSTADSDPAIVMDDLPPTLDQHAHPDQGPHGGELIELGQGAFHAELTHEQEDISIYVLDSSCTKPVAIASEKLTVSLKHEGQVNSFDLAPSPDNNDPAGMTSRFTSSDPQLGQWLEAGAEGAVVIQIEGKSYNGKIAHDHDHDDHDHDDHDHDDHDH